MPWIIEKLWNRPRLRDALEKLVKRLAAFFAFGEKELTSPPGWWGKPIYMRNLMNNGELLVVSDHNSQSSTAITSRYDFHTFKFDTETGFDSKGYFKDKGLPVQSTIKQVLGGPTAKLAFVLVDRPITAGLLPGGRGVRIYRTYWRENPSVQYVRTLHTTEEIVAMGNDPVLTALISEQGVIYVYRNIGVNRDVELDHQSDLPKQMGITVKRANVLSYANILIEEIVNGQSRVWRFTRSGAGSTYHHFGVPTAPSEDALGERHVRLQWYIGQSTAGGPVGYGIWADLVITGNNEWIKIYYFPGTGWEYRLVKYRDADGTLYDSYLFPELVRDWDLRFKGNDYQGVLYMIAAQESGTLRASNLDMTLLSSGQSYFQVHSQQIETQGDVHCVFWSTSRSHFLINPRFEIHADGRLCFRGTRML